MNKPTPVFVNAIGQLRRPLLLWAIALSAVSTLYLSFYPSMGGGAMDDLVADLPEDLVTALGYDVIGTAGGWVTGTVYGLLGPILLLVFSIGTGAKLLAGEEEAGTLELEATAPVSRLQILIERLLTLVVGTVFLVAVVTAVCWILIVVLDMGVPFDRLLAGSAGLLLLTLGFGTIAFSVGAATGKRAMAMGSAAALAVLAFVFDALGPVVDQQWMSEVSPFYWYLGKDPIIDGFDWAGLIKLAAVPALAAAVAVATFPGRDLRV